MVPGIIFWYYVSASNPSNYEYASLTWPYLTNLLSPTLAEFFCIESWWFWHFLRHILWVELFICKKWWWVPSRSIARPWRERRLPGAPIVREQKKTYFICINTSIPKKINLDYLKNILYFVLYLFPSISMGIFKCSFQFVYKKSSSNF